MLNSPSPVETGNNQVTVLIVSNNAGDFEALRSILAGSKWKIYKAVDNASAFRQLRRRASVSLIVCDREFWKELIAYVVEMRDAPLVIVAANNADEQLWAEALNFGAYDVLAKPFEAGEVVRSLSLGWLHRRRESERARLLRNPRVATV